LKFGLELLLLMLWDQRGQYVDTEGLLHRLSRRPAFEPAALVGAFEVVPLQILVQIPLDILGLDVPGR
jgi:hypothetical protein